MYFIRPEAASSHASPGPHVHIVRHCNTDVRSSTYLIIMGALDGLRMKRQLGYCRLRGPFSRSKTTEANSSKGIQRSSWVYTSFSDRPTRSLEDYRLRRQESSSKDKSASGTKGNHNRSYTAPAAAHDAITPCKTKKLGPFQRMLSLRKSKKASKKTPGPADHPLEEVWRESSTFHRFDSLAEQEEPVKREGGRHSVKTTVLITYVTTV